MSLVTTRCAHCSALLPEAAEWCTQCFSRTAPDPAGPPAGEPGPEIEAAVVPRSGGTGDGEEPALDEAELAALLEVPEVLRSSGSTLSALRQKDYGIGTVVLATLVLTLLLAGALVLPQLVGPSPTQVTDPAGPFAGIPASAPVEDPAR